MQGRRQIGPQLARPGGDDPRLLAHPLHQRDGGGRETLAAQQRVLLGGQPGAFDGGIGALLLRPEQDQGAVGAGEHRREPGGGGEDLFGRVELGHGLGHLQQRRRDPGLFLLGLIQAAIFDGDGDLRGEGLQHRQVALAERAHAVGLQIEHAQDALFDL